ncbi:MAG: ATP-dependent helicase HrpB [Gammaproteobacteria bacterium]|nr:ATP-dependent helicase HrpB [Pseudomonadales bacterium]MCP5349288.1 ATP-dependent helicase HrpB [Pseudomonadales bacterium]
MPLLRSNLHLPVTKILEELKSTLNRHHEAILQAPPGAGKTTLVPLALAAEPWLGDRKILILEPRRIAARAAAHRMADLLDEAVGQSVGYRIRLDTRVSSSTKIEVITEGILTRMLQEDPSLADVGLVIFDEFHERSLDADLALALCLKGRSLFREDDPLKLLIMSATLDSHRLEELTGAPVVRSEGKQYPVDIVYGKSSQPKDSIHDKTVTAILGALADNPDSSILVFLPGQGEIRRVEDSLAIALQSRRISDVKLRALYGNLSLEEQQAAIAPAANPGERKVVLATNIAETSLTIEGVDVVIDSGLAREPVFDPTSGMTRLHTRRISQSSSIQRMGRAGRLRPGKCYRLWSKSQQDQLAPHATPEILNADLAPVALQLLQWGIDDPDELAWMDPPGRGPWLQAVALLTNLGAIVDSDNGLRLTEHGTQMAGLAVHPRLAHMLLCGQSIGRADTASLLASILSDRDPFGRDTPDMNDRLDILTEQSTCPNQHRGWFRRSHQLAEQFRAQISGLKIEPDAQLIKHDQVTGYLIACAYPDRIARRRHAGGFQLANGRGVSLAGNHSLGESKWLAVAEVGGSARSKGDTIHSAAALDATLFDSLLADQIASNTVVEWDGKTKRFIAEERQEIGALILSRSKLSEVPADAKQEALIKTIQTSGLEILPFTRELRQWQARVELVRTTTGNTDWPEVSDQHLLASLKDWLGPYLEPINLLSHFKKLDLQSILTSLLTWEQNQQLNVLAPQRLQVPSGSSYALDYTATPPVLAVKLQEMFGCIDTPTVLNGQVPVTVHLLSPAGRPLQVTQNLASFWDNSYQDVRKEMKGRYPKHPWPEDPRNAVPTGRAKPRRKG